MHISGAIKFCICSVILGELEGFPNCKGFSVIFPKISARLEITAGQQTMSGLIVELTVRGTQRLFSVKYLFGEVNIASNSL